MSFARHLLPDPAGYFESQGLSLVGRGKWRTTRCEFHGGSDSMRVNVESGAWVCMNCGEKGGDVLAYQMAAHGVEFAEACKALGCWEDDGKPTRSKPAPFNYKAACEVQRDDALFVAVAACNVANGIGITDGDRKRLIEVARTFNMIAEGIA